MPILHFYNNVIVAKCASSKEMIIVEKSLLTRKTNENSEFKETLNTVFNNNDNIMISKTVHDINL